MEGGGPPRRPPDEPPQPPRDPLEPPTDDWPTGDYPTRDYPDVPEEERERRRIPRERRPPVRKHRRHRDLPAKVRRRQAIGGTVLVLAVGVGALLLFGGGDDGDDGAQEPAKIPISKLVGQTIVGKVSRAGPSKALLGRVKRGELGGAILLRPPNEKAARAAANRLQKAATAGGNPPLLIMIDQEGGTVKRLPQGPPNVSAAELGATNDVDGAKVQGEQTGEYLAKLGINVDLAPVADVATPQTAQTIAERTFGDDPEAVAELVVAFSEGLDQSVAATVKHFPGLGFATENTDFSGEVTIRNSQQEIEESMTPFSAAIDAGVGLVLLSNAIYPAFGSPLPAPFAKPIVEDELRDRLGFNGVAITDDLESPATTKALPPDQGAARALALGVDMVLFAKSEGASATAYKTLLRRATAGKLSRAALEQAYERITKLKQDLPEASAASASEQN